MSALLFLALSAPLVAVAQDLWLSDLLAPTYPNQTDCLKQPSFYSCENTTVIKNTCCSPYPGGLVLSTQYWDTITGMEHEGQLLPNKAWTLHGLWPDFCNGSYTQYCDLTRQYDPDPSPNTTNGEPNGTPVPPYPTYLPNVDSFIKDFGRLDLLEYMWLYWVGWFQESRYFWAHEFSKHATCTSCFDPKCYGTTYRKNQEVIDFFDAAIKAYEQYPTYKMLAAYDIVPSNTTWYDLVDLQNAIYSQIGGVPYFGCTGDNYDILDEVWYYQHVWGCEQTGHYKVINSTDESGCASKIMYPERATGSVRVVELETTVVVPY